MKKVSIYFLTLFSLSVFANQAAVFSLTAEEMVFASKLSDENRRQFCYKFSPKERLQCLEELKKKDLTFSYDQIVEQIAHVDSLEKSFLR
ncbi:MAG: hypothetical protein JSS09_03025 [Verrucomicrobia bacterium]|nr:hypothetical protein [Verrucomicrobiota bacterium]